MNWRPPKLEELTVGLSCEIIDMRASADNIQDAMEAKRLFKREIQPSIVFKSHILTEWDVEYYKSNHQFITRDLRISSEL